MKLLTEEEAAKLVNDDDLKPQAIANVEQNGIVFLDEIDKITSRAERRGADVSRQGVQRDLLPLVEGTTVVTKYGMIKTDHILFIACGAFHLAKPSDLIPELQGRFPIRVELASAVGRRFRADPDQHRRLPDAPVRSAAGDRRRDASTFSRARIKRLAEIAWQVNEKTENIGARRLYTVMEKLLEEISFDAGEPRRRGGRGRCRLRRQPLEGAGAKRGPRALRALTPGLAPASIDRARALVL